MSPNDIDTTETLLHRWSRVRRSTAISLREKARQARGAAARWEKRSFAYAAQGLFREADDCITEVVALGRLAEDFEEEIKALRSKAKRIR